MSLEKHSMQELVAAVAGPRQWGDTRQSWLARAARRAGISYRQAKSLFYGQTGVNHDAARKMREAAGRHEARNLAGRFEGLANALVVKDEDFYSSDVTALLDAARALRGLDRSRIDGDDS